VQYDEQENGRADFASMKMMLAGDFAVKQKEILGKDYPE
jgi:hypothetical protein